jgi:hypothetical protein
MKSPQINTKRLENSSDCFETNENQSIFLLAYNRLRIIGKRTTKTQDEKSQKLTSTSVGGEPGGETGNE